MLCLRSIEKYKEDDAVIISYSLIFFEIVAERFFFLFARFRLSALNLTPFFYINRLFLIIIILF
jgi:hypothetical protein